MEYLNKKNNKLIYNKFNFEYNKNNTNVAVIFQTTDNLELFCKIIKNNMYYLGSEWNLHIIGLNQSKIKNKLVKCSFRWSQSNKIFFNNKEYNDILSKKTFWNLINENNILLFDMDIILNKSPDYLFFNYDFIKHGNLFFFKKQIILNIIENNNSLLDIIHQTVNSKVSSKLLNYKLPSKKILTKFENLKINLKKKK